MCLRTFEIYVLKYWLEFAPSLTAPVLAWQATLKETKVKLDFLTDIDILLMLEEGIRGGICQAIHRHAKANNKYMENYDKNHHILNIGMWIIIDVKNIGGQCPIRYL